MADDSLVVQLLAKKFKNLSLEQIRAHIQSLPNDKQAAAVAAAQGGLSEKNYGKLLLSIPDKIADALKLLITKGSRENQYAVAGTSLVAAVRATGARLSTGALAGALAAGEGLKRVSCRVTGLVANVYEVIVKGLGSAKQALEVFSQAAARVPIWSERYGQVNPELLQNLIKKFGVTEAFKQLGLVSGQRVPPFKSRYDTASLELPELQKFIPAETLQKLKNKLSRPGPRVAVSDARYRAAFNNISKKLRGAGASVGSAAAVAHAYASTGGPRVSWSRSSAKNLPPISSGLMDVFYGIRNRLRAARTKEAVYKALQEFKKSTGVSPAWIQAIELSLARPSLDALQIEAIAKNFANKVEKFATNQPPSSGPPVPPVPVIGPGPAPQPPINQLNETTLRNKSLEDLVKIRRTYPAKKNVINRYLGSKIEQRLSNAGRTGTSSIREVLRLVKNVPNLPGKDKLFDIIESRVQDIESEARNNPMVAKERLRRFRSAIGYTGGLFGNRNIGRIFSNAEREYNRKILDNKRRRMNENRNRRGLPPLPAPRYNLGPPEPRYNLGGSSGVFRPPANQPVPNLRGTPRPPPLNAGPPLNMGEMKAINNVGGPNRALNLVQNAGGVNNVLRAANQLKEAGGSPEMAIAKGANAKNVKIVLQLGGANNATKIATATPKLRKRRRSKKKTAAKGKARPRVAAIKKLIRSLPKKKLLSVLPKKNKEALANKNKANVATRVTSFLAGRTKAKK